MERTWTFRSNRSEQVPSSLIGDESAIGPASDGGLITITIHDLAFLQILLPLTSYDSLRFHIFQRAQIFLMRLMHLP